jgi:hypothetical protein
MDQRVHSNDDTLRQQWNIHHETKLNFRPLDLDLWPVSKMFSTAHKDHLIIAGERDGGLEDQELAEPFAELVKLLIKSWARWASSHLS